MSQGAGLGVEHWYFSRDLYLRRDISDRQFQIDPYRTVHLDLDAGLDDGLKTRKRCAHAVASGVQRRHYVFPGGSGGRRMLHVRPQLGNHNGRGRDRGFAGIGDCADDTAGLHLGRSGRTSYCPDDQDRERWEKPIEETQVPVRREPKHATCHGTPPMYPDFFSIKWRNGTAHDLH